MATVPDIVPVATYLPSSLKLKVITIRKLQVKWNYNAYFRQNVNFLL